MELYDLPDGEYILHEKTAPDGFTCITDFRFTITDGKVTTTGTASVETEDAGLTVRDEASSVSIVKVGKDGESTKELPGASMKLTYTGSADLSKATAENGEISGNTEGSKEITWTSGDKAIKLNQIPDGKYTLEETIAPDGYDLTTEITFDVVNGKVENVQVGDNQNNKYNENDNLITVFDDLKPITTTTTETTTTTTTTETTEETTTTATTPTSAGPTLTTTEETTTEATTKETTTEETTTTATTLTSAGPTVKIGRAHV